MHYLARILQSTSRECKVRIPNSLVAFVCLVQLHDIVYPGRWLGDFLHNVLADNFIATQNVWNGILPIPVSDISECTAHHKARLDPWKTELEAIVTTSLQGLPFAIRMPPGLAADVKDIGHFKTHVLEAPTFKFFNPFQIDPVVWLISYNAKRWSWPDVQRMMTKTSTSYRWPHGPPIWDLVCMYITVFRKLLAMGSAMEDEQGPSTKDDE